MYKQLRNIFDLLIDPSAMNSAFCSWWIGQQEVLMVRRKCLLKPEWRV
jgi:hypothetical protein